MPPAASVIVPTYNRLPQLQRCLEALASQTLDPAAYEIIVVDDGSNDGTAQWLAKLSCPNLKVFRHRTNLGRVKARNLGIQAATAQIIIFIDSDVVAAPALLQEHLQIHQRPGRICQGSLILATGPEERPRWFFLTDFSRADFATGNVSVAKAALVQAGLFDEAFCNYGWEDLELGLRLRQQGLKVVRNRRALGYHLEEPFHPDQLPDLIAKEQARGTAAAYFYRKHPTLEVRLMIQWTPFHFWLDRLLTGNGRDQRWLGFISRIQAKHPKLALALARGVLNHYNLEALREAMAPQD